MSAHRHQRRHDHDQDHHGRRHPAREETAAEDNSAVIAQMGPAVQGPAPAAADGGPMVEMPDWAADIGEEEAPAAAWGGSGPALALAPTPEAPGVEEGGTEGGATSGGVAPAEDPGLVSAEGQAELDAIIPPGVGFELHASAKLAVVLGLAAGATVKVLNDGNGLLEVSCTADLSGTVDGGVGEEIAEVGAGASVGGAVERNTERVFKLPWTHFVTPAVLAAIALSPLLDVVEEMLTGQDLSPYLMKATDGIGLSAEGSGLVGLPGKGLGAEISAEASVGLTFGLEYDELAENGVRKGTCSVAGDAECVIASLTDLWAAGIEVDLKEGITGAVSVHVPFVETNGVPAYGTPYVRTEAEVTGEANGYRAEAGGSVEVGDDHAAVEVHAAIGSGMDLWDDVLGGPVAHAVGSVLDVDVSGKMTLGLEVDLSGVKQAADTMAPAVLTWLTTGQIPEVIAPILTEVETVVAKTAPTLGVELELLNVGGEAGGGIAAGGKVEGELGVGGKILYEREDLFEELGVKPTLPNILGYLRGSAPAAA